MQIQAILGEAGPSAIGRRRLPLHTPARQGRKSIAQGEPGFRKPTSAKSPLGATESPTKDWAGARGGRLTGEAHVLFEASEETIAAGPAPAARGAARCWRVCRAEHFSAKGSCSAG